MCPLAAPQYPLDYYPPFASGCGFVLSRDLVRALLAQPLPDYRLLVRGPACWVSLTRVSVFDTCYHACMAAPVSQALLAQPLPDCRLLVRGVRVCMRAATRLRVRARQHVGGERCCAS